MRLVRIVHVIVYRTCRSPVRVPSPLTTIMADHHGYRYAMHAAPRATVLISVNNTMMNVVN